MIDFSFLNEEITPEKLIRDGDKSVYYVTLKNETMLFFQKDDKGKRTGPFVVKDQEGEKIWQGSYQKGQIDGQMTEFWPQTKTPKSICHVRNGIKTGPYALFSANGQKELEGTYNEDGKEQGEHFVYDDGQLYARVFFKDGELNGPALTLYENGAPETFFHYVHNRPDGAKFEYYPPRGIHIDIDLTDKIKLRKSLFNRALHLSSKTIYEHGVPQSYQRFYFNGEKQEEGDLNADGYADGLITKYTADGKKSAEMFCRDGLLLSERTFFSNGVVKSTAHYKNGELNGLVTFYWPDGKKKISYLYHNGKMLQSGSKIYSPDGTIYVSKKGQFIPTQQVKERD